jgi:serine/threonine protein kinase
MNNSPHPSTIGKWRILRRLGRGGQAETFIGAHLDTGEKAAIKVFDPMIVKNDQESYQEYKKRFNRECTILMKLNNDHICKLFEAELDGNPPWMAIQFFNGPTLFEQVSHEGALPEIKWFELASGILEGLVHAHSKNVIHKDLNPKNVILNPLGAKLIDFGIAHLIGTTRFTQGGVWGVTDYLSPEQIENKNLGTKSDLFSLASLLVYAGRQKSPWISEASNGKPFMEILTKDPDYSGLTANQKNLLRPMHDKDPRNRISAEEALKLIRKLSPTYVERSVKADKKTLTAAKEAKSQIKAEKIEKRDLGGLSEKQLFYLFGPFNVLKLKQLIEKVLVQSKAVKARNPLPQKKLKSFPKDNSYAPKSMRAWHYFLGIGMFFSLGTTGAFLTLIYAINRKTRDLIILASIQIALVFWFFVSLFTTPTDGELASAPILSSLLHFPLTFIAYKNFKEIKTFSNSTNASDLAQEDLAPAPALLEVEEPPLQKKREVLYESWTHLEIEVCSILESGSIERLNLSFDSPETKGVYFQGFREEGGYITIEASANLSVQPNITKEQNKSLIALGWEPPSPGFPNYIKYLDLLQSNAVQISKIMTETLRDGYKIPLPGLTPAVDAVVHGENMMIPYRDLDEWIKKGLQFNR